MTRRFIQQVAGVALAAAAFGTVAVAGGPVAAQARTPADWSRNMQGDLSSRLFPEFAAVLGISGRATLRCEVERDGPVYVCDVVAEAPVGMGFGTAARVAITSGAFRAARVNGVIEPGQIQTTITFMAEEGAPFGGWTGPEPTPEALAFARELVTEKARATPEDLPSPWRETMMKGLDHDRRAVVGPWIDELLPYRPERQNEVIAIQLARVFSLDQLRRIQAGERMTLPSDEVLESACPDPTPAELAAIEELRRRYCDRYGCSMDYAATTD